MTTTITEDGQITIPKHIRDLLSLAPGSRIEVTITQDGSLLLRKESVEFDPEEEFDKAIGSADLPWRTEDLMALLRGEN